ncbi:MAG: glycosyltransferase family 2 protein [Gammaproteobacteria bacterium]|nr:glycosyltransferase family 2 protein [Gammaproteobacteria bacterium]
MILSTELSIIVPTYNESGNVQALLELIRGSLPDCEWEVVFVDDDSPDGTSRIVREIAARDRRVRCIQRLGRRGLSSACVEGMLSTVSPYLCVMDADLQHDTALLPDMLARLKAGDLDLVIGSRYVDAGSTGDLGRARAWMSRLATRLSRLLTGLDVRDPMSGFFMMRRPFFENVMHRISGRGFKILLDALMSAEPPAVYVELPYRMRTRSRGESKLSARVLWDFLIMLIDKLAGRMVPARFISFATVGFSGIFVQIFALWILHRVMSAAFVPADAVATLVAMTTNFSLNNYFTYADRRLSGKAFLRGLLSFYAACAFGAIINVSLAATIVAWGYPWWLAGSLGAVAGAVWNYAITAVFTWPKGA